MADVDGYDPSTDQDLAQANGAMAAARQKDKELAAQSALEAAGPKKPDQPSGFQHWFTDLPQNIGSGLINAAVNTADLAHSSWKWVNDGQKEAAAKLKLSDPGATTTEMQDQLSGIQTPEYDHVRSVIQGFNNNVISVKNPTLSDDVTQGIAQFAIPFLGWSKAVSAVGGASKLAAAGRTLVAESATAGTVMGAHDGRFADMVDLGKHVEGKFGAALQAITPDGSALNTYIDYMTNRGDETEAEGRMKNIIDTVAGGAVLSPIIRTGMRMLKGGLEGLKYSLENGVGSIDQLAVPNQEGKIGYHGTPHDFDPATGFDNSKIGTGEGQQAYGYGHYLAESPDVAGQYQRRLSTRNMGANQDAAKAVRDFGGDTVKAYKSYADALANETDPQMRARLQSTMAVLKNGNAGRGTGSVVTADIPDTHYANMLDHDKPMSEQQSVLDKIPEADKQRLQQFLEENDRDGNGSLEDLKGGQFRQLVEKGISEGVIDGPDLMDDHFPRQAAAYLDSKGIPGIKYLDGLSRKGGEGTKNIVLFNGKNAAVIAKNGKPVGIDAAPRQDMSLSKEERALERERVAAQRQREDGTTPEPTPEPIPARAAAVEGEAARRDAEPVPEDNRVMGSDGQPKVFYRGRDATATPGDSVRANVPYFTDSKDAAHAYSHDGNVMAAHLEMKKPATEADIRRVAEAHGIDLIDDGHPAAYLEQSPKLVKALQKEGYDGATGKDSLPDDQGPITSHVVFDKGQVKQLPPELTAGEQERRLSAKPVDKLSNAEIQAQIDKLRAEAERRRGADPDAKIASSRN